MLRETFQSETWDGDIVDREVNLTIPDIRALAGSAGFAHLVLAGNQHLTAWEIWEYLRKAGCPRSLAWVRRRRWMYRPPGASYRGTKPNRDGKADRAARIMRDNRTVSLRELRRILAEYGIKRSVEWIRRHRVD